VGLDSSGGELSLAWSEEAVFARGRSDAEAGAAEANTWAGSNAVVRRAFAGDEEAAWSVLGGSRDETVADGLVGSRASVGRGLAVGEWGIGSLAGGSWAEDVAAEVGGLRGSVAGSEIGGSEGVSASSGLSAGGEGRAALAFSDDEESGLGIASLESLSFVDADGAADWPGA
jgi:hypothetical protein